ncbi:cell surface protein, partial [Rhodococcus erythropolis]|nr:cell surface protein [Rhodococcus erythropolis]
MGTPLSSQFTGDGNLLFITQLGQINVLNPQTGAKVVPSFDLIPPPSIDQGANAELIPDNKGLNECFLGTSGCPVANTPAVDLGTGKFYFTF